MSEHNTSPDRAVRHEAIDISDFVHAATGSRVRRVTLPDGTHWFPASDVCRRLGYTTTRKALVDHVPETYREMLQTVTGRHGLGIPPGREWRRDLQMVNLQGLVQLVNGCTKPEAMPFKQWVTEVVVAVQRDGVYELEPAAVQSPDPAAPVAYAMPQPVVDAIVRLEERNLRTDEMLAAVQRESLATQQRVADAVERIAAAVEGMAAGGRHPEPDAPAEPAAPVPAASAREVLDRWRRRLPRGSRAWPVALYLLPHLVEQGEVRMSVDFLAVKAGLTAQQTSLALTELRRHGCVEQRGFADNGSPVLVPCP
ncbi:BRO family protein [Streptomyces chumphonensis]|uniref:Bro-N domain-containing protein n=1 Tax=Streptomyces chumphonensis TaxID=1214925 RepID=A0A927F1D2_9ACTN|nr:Bro-N domain-containing protein [Streptomyces chumphonensis]MBD3933215.1 Bro-N domain-containing protein [Streptomyces chumphonensis]